MSKYERNTDIEIALRLKWKLDFSREELSQWSQDLIFYLYCQIYDSPYNGKQYHNARIIRIEDWANDKYRDMKRHLIAYVVAYHQQESTDPRFDPIIDMT